ncbi:MAG: restriction endonuclease subunit S [Fusobacterium ulcerans]|uniref:restriction endonuclease subunit S n=1 Tax=Fusobacterium ulcerans TaxID=861 RepID=UPI003A8717C9
MAKNKDLTLEEKLREALIPKDEQPYEIPENWEWVRFNSIVEILNGDRGKNYPSKDKLIKTGTIPFISAINLENGKILLDKLLFLKEEQYNNLRAGRIKEKDFLFCIRGSLGKFGKNFYERGAIASSLVILRTINKERIVNNFIGKYLDTNLMKREILKYNNGTAQPNLSAENLGKFLFPLPPLKEQKRIVEKLDSMFEKINKAKDLIKEVKENIENRKESILNKAFRGELTAEWRKNNQTEDAIELLKSINEEKIKNWEQACIEAEKNGKKKPSKPKIEEIQNMMIPKEEGPYEIPKNWKWVKLENISSKITDGSHNPPKNEKSIYKMLSARNIFDRKINFFENDRTISKENYKIENDRTKIEKNDIALTIVGTIGRTALINSENINLTFQRSVAIVRTKVFQKYIELFMNSKFFYEELHKNAKGTAQLGVYLNKLKELKIVLPPLKEQEEIVRILDEILEKESKIKELIELEETIELLKKSILDKAFRGELGTQNKEDEPAIELLKKIL